METLMYYGMIAVAILAAWHFFYEGILAPSIRLKLRYKLFALRDQLRDIESNVSEEAFELLNECLNSHIALLGKVHIYDMIRFYKELQKNEPLRDEVKDLDRKLDQCQQPEYVEIRRNATHVMSEGLIYNSLGWLPYIVPPIIVGLFWSKCYSLIKKAFLVPSGFGPELSKV